MSRGGQGTERLFENSGRGCPFLESLDKLLPHGGFGFPGNVAGQVDHALVRNGVGWDPPLISTLKVGDPKADAFWI